MNDAALDDTLTPAEEKLLAECHETGRITFGDGERPEESTPDVTVRANVLRRLLLGQGEVSLNPKGLRLRGAWVSGGLDLQGTDCNRDITLGNCTLEAPLNLVNARLRGLHLMGCEARGVMADNAHFAGSLYIRGNTACIGEISLAGARIAGDMQACGATIKSDGQDAIFAPSLRVDGSLFLGNYPYADGETTLTTTGAIFLSSVHVAHDVFLTHTEVSLNDDALLQHVFDGSEEHGADISVSLARAQVGGILYLQNNQITRGLVNLAGARVARLSDEPEGPGAAYAIRLDGFRYGDFSRHTDVSPSVRLRWLERRPSDLAFTAQPYEQLALVLNRIGHRADAQTVLMHKERLLRAESRRLLPTRGGLWALMMAGDWIMHVTIGYGYRPGRAILLAIFLICGLALFFGAAWRAGDMAPAPAPILVSEGWLDVVEAGHENPAKVWSAPGAAGQDFETFNAVAYAADLVIPLISFGQEDTWAPSTSRGPLGRMGWWLRWVAKIVGWIVTALGAAALTGLIRKE
ncbi:MAG: hypothetical protein AAFY03_04705 [Pseudomonadota bacterium]